MPSKKLLLFPLIVFLLSSCDCVYNYTYEVENQSSSTIKVKWEASDFVGMGPLDSLEIEPGNTSALFSTGHGIEPCRTGPFFRDVNQMFIAITITKDDTIVSKLDFLENAQWNFDDGLYTAAVADSAF
jgi:hypothetical protein